MSWPSLLLGSGQGQSAPPRSSNDAILPTFKDVRQFLLSWPFYVIRTRMEISDTGFWTELKALREEGQLMPGPMQLWRGVVPGWCHNLLFHLVQRSMCVLLRKLFMKPKKMPALQYDRWSQKMNKLERLTAENRLRDSEGHSTVQLALSAARPLVKAATGERESIDVAIDAASAIIAALVSYPFLVISTFSITGAMSLSQLFAMIKMGLQAKKSKSGGAEGSKPRGGGNKMLSMVGGMLFKGVKYRVAGVVISYGLRAVSNWLLLKLLERALRVAENALGQKKRAEQENEEEEEELEEIGSARSRQLGPANDYKELIALAKKFGVQMVALLAVDLLIKHILAHPFEVMSARERVSVPVRQGSLWRGFFLRACFGSFYS